MTSSSAACCPLLLETACGCPNMRLGESRTITINSCTKNLVHVYKPVKVEHSCSSVTAFDKSCYASFFLLLPQTSPMVVSPLLSFLPSLPPGMSSALCLVLSTFSLWWLSGCSGPSTPHQSGLDWPLPGGTISLNRE